MFRMAFAALLSGGALVAACGTMDVAPPPDRDPSSSSSGGAGTGGMDATGGGGQAELPERADVQCPLAPLVNEVASGWQESGVLGGNGDRAYWRFTGARGSAGCTLLGMTAPGFNGVIRLYNAEGTEVLLTVDDHRPHSDGLDAWANYLFPYDGVYCMELLSAEDWLGRPTTDKGATPFSVMVNSWVAPWGSDISSVDTEPNDDVLDAQALPIQETHLIAGQLTASDQRDVYMYEPTVEPSYPWFQVFPAPPGPGGDIEGWGFMDVTISIVDADGVTVLARQTASDSVTNCDGVLRACGPRADKPVTSGEPRYIVVEPAQSGQTGTYSFHINEGESSGFDVEPPEDGSNDTEAGASISMTVNDSFRGRLEDGDTDWWRLPEIPASQEYGIHCRSNLEGSGVQAFQVEAIEVGDPNLAVVQSEVEGTASPLRWSQAYDARFRPSMPPLPGGTAYYLRLSASGWDTENRGRDYQCEVEVVAASN